MTTATLSTAKKPYLTPGEASDEIDIRVQSILAWIASGELPATNLSLSRNAKRPTWRIARADLELFLANRRTGSTIEVVSADIGSAFGHLADAYVFDELCHWSARAEGLYQALMSGVPKRPHAVLLVLTNAPIIDSWQWPIREHARTDSDRWHFSRLEGPVASWIRKADLEEQRKSLPANVYNRLWLNRPMPSAGDAIQADLIDAAVTEKRGPRGLAPGFVGPVMGLDLGLRHDRSSAVLLCIDHPGRRIVLLEHESWAACRPEETSFRRAPRSRFSLGSKAGRAGTCGLGRGIHACGLVVKRNPGRAAARGHSPEGCFRQSDSERSVSGHSVAAGLHHT